MINGFAVFRHLRLRAAKHILRQEQRQEPKKANVVEKRGIMGGMLFLLLPAHFKRSLSIREQVLGGKWFPSLVLNMNIQENKTLIRECILARTSTTRNGTSHVSCPWTGSKFLAQSKPLFNAIFVGFHPSILRKSD